MDEYLRHRPPTNLLAAVVTAVVGQWSGPGSPADPDHTQPEHVLNHYPLMAPFRHIIADPHTGHIDYYNLFHTIKGAHALANFLLRSNSPLRPLPPRLDPP